MADETKPKDWAALINAVRTPLGFFTLLALILESGLVAASAASSTSLWAPLGVLVAMFVTVTFVALWNPKALYHPADWPAPQRAVTVSLVFPPEADVDLDVERCLLEVRDKLGQMKTPRSRPNIVLGHGGWVLNAPEDVDSSDSVRLDLVEVQGRKWKVKPFRLYETTVTAVEAR